MVKKQTADMQMNVASVRRNIKNLAHNYSDAQIKVREATSNDPWGPSSTIMAEIADLTYNVVAFSEIMQMIWKRTNDHGKNWRHVYKALLLLEYLIKTGTEKVAQQCKENIYAIQTLKDFQYLEEGKDQGTHVREKAKQLVSLLKDDERLKNERARALKAKERFARTASGFGSDGSIDGPSTREAAVWLELDQPSTQATAQQPRPASDLEFVRPQTVGEEELQLQLAMAMSREEADQEEQKKRSDEVRLQLALSQSENDFKTTDTVPKKPEQSHLLDLLDISFGATSISNNTNDPWSGSAAGGNRPQVNSTDPWSRTSSPPTDPWLTTAPPPTTKPPPVGFSGLDGWPSRTDSPSVTSGSSVEGWLQNVPAPAAAPSHLQNNGNADPWLGGVAKPPVAVNPLADPWLNKSASPIINDPFIVQPTKPSDPWAPIGHSTATNDAFGFPATRLSPVGAATITSPASDLDEFDIITNRNKNNVHKVSTSPLQMDGNHLNNNNNLLNTSSLLDDLDPLSPKNASPVTMNKTKTPQSFLGENSALVNLDNLIKPSVPIVGLTGAFNNPFGDAQLQQQQQQRTNMFQQPPVPSINQLKQSPFPVTLNQDPWAPANTTSTQNNNAATNTNGNNNAPWMNPQPTNPFLS